MPAYFMEKVQGGAKKHVHGGAAHTKEVIHLLKYERLRTAKNFWELLAPS